MRLLVSATDHAAFSTALRMALRQGHDVVQVPEMNLFSVEGLPARTVERIQKQLGQKISVREERQFAHD